MSLGLVCLAHISGAQVPNLDSYKRAKVILHIDKNPKKKVEGVTFFFGSGSANDSILFYVENCKVQTIVPSPVFQEGNWLKSISEVHFGLNHPTKTIRVIAVSLKQKQYISLSVDNRYQLIRMSFYPDSSYVEKTNIPLVFE
ncbi:hypothetical protein HW554_14895 [Hymenobacter sp. P5342]|uniref:Uncharacterized protein n=1 Tax=Hymenobacter lapidiphilus TaxID=2608003 RepID=A0A7Y7PR43_9BACT|nr:hypothetical protein [Hymenobacter lapidiphilus]